MKALVVVTQPPLLEGGAVGRAAVGLLRGLASHGIDARALAAKPPGGHRGTIPPDLLVDTVAINHEVFGLARHIHRLKRPLSEFRSGPFAATARALAKDVDVVNVVEEAAFAVEDVAKPSVFYVHCLTELDRRMGWPWTEHYRWGVESRLAEREAFRRHRYIAANSSVVADVIRRRAPHAEVIVAPLSLEPSYYPRAPLDGPPTAGFIGTVSWPPTKRALDRLLHRIWPIVHRAVPDARLVLAGRHFKLPPGTHPGVELAGEVRSATDFLSGLSVLLYPLPYGSGMKVKVLESIACGLPVVTTRDGAEGIEAPGGVIVEADDELLAAAAVEILRDPAARRQRGALAREAFERRYAPVPATEPLVDLFRRIA